VADFSFGPFVLEGASSRLLRDGIEVRMRPQAFAALRTLASHPGHFVTYDQLIEEAWGGTIVSRHTVNVTIGEVRRLLDDCGSWIEWRPKLGHRLRVPQYDTLVHLGWHFANLRSREGFDHALQCFRGAAAEAPHDHRAYEGQAACYLMKASFGTQPGREMFEAFLRAHEQAVALVGMTPEIRCNYAHAIHIYQRRLDEALVEFDRVITDQPELAIAHVRRALLLVTMGDLDQALDSAARGRAAAPLQPLTATAEVNVRIWRREYDQAVVLGERAMQMHPYFMLSRIYYGMALEFAGRLDAALEQYHIGGVITHGLAWVRGLEGTCLAKLGRTGDARAVLAALLEQQRREYVDTYALARLRLALGDLDGAFLDLERAVDESVSGLYALSVDPTADGFRSDPRFRRLLDRYLTPIGAPAPDLVTS
jgi:tetratricopeptide (TPR) repeat protein